MEITQKITGKQPTQAELAAENQSLRARLAYLIEQAERNHSIMTRHQAFDLEIVGAASFPELIGTIFRSLPVISDLDAVTLSLVDVDDDIRTVMEKLGVDFSGFPNLVFVPQVESLAFELDPGQAPKPYLGMFDPDKHGPQFPQPGMRLQSVGVVPLLRNKRLIGSLNLGSADPARFSPSLGTDFVEHMASIIAICLENVISNEMLKYMGLTDALTGVFNRRYVDRRLLEEIARARRQAYPVSFMYIDIDHFKRVNDTVGHGGGDEVLREVANRIKAELRLSDALARFGGEEFVVLLIDADLESATYVGERIRAGIAASMIELSHGVKVSITASVGVSSLALVPGDASPEEQATLLIEQADEALYQAKEGGRNRVIRYAA
jgi:two-component system, cell cycle response regulator